MATQTKIAATLRPKAVLRKALRECISAERKAEKAEEAAKEETKKAAAEVKKSRLQRRSVEDELEQVSATTDEEW